MKNKLELLKTKEAAALANFNKIMQKRVDLESSLRMPELQKIYEGKYFKVKNGYNMGVVIYFKCLKVLVGGFCDCISFQTIQDSSEITFKVEGIRRCTLSILETEISKNEFKAAQYKLFMNMTKVLDEPL